MWGVRGGEDMRSPGEFWTGGSWVFCRSWWATLQSWHRQGACSTTALPQQRGELMTEWAQPRHAQLHSFGLEEEHCSTWKRDSSTATACGDGWYFRMISALAFGEMIVISVCCYSVRTFARTMNGQNCLYINSFKSGQKHETGWRLLKILSSQRKYFSTAMKISWRNTDMFWHIFKAKTNNKKTSLIPLSISNQNIVFNN